MFKFHNILPQDRIASVGCAGGLWEIAWSFELNQVEFHLQEIDKGLLNETEVKNTIKYFEKQYNKTLNCSFEITIGTSTDTNLPTKYFDKVFLINSFHEFEHQAIMLNECRRILKINGQLIIEEQLAKHSQELHKGCGKKLFLELELIETVKKSGFNRYESHIFENKITIFFKS